MTINIHYFDDKIESLQEVRMFTVYNTYSKNQVPEIIIHFNDDNAHRLSLSIDMWKIDKMTIMSS